MHFLRWFKFHWNIFSHVPCWQYAIIGSENGLAANRRQIIIWNNYVLFYWRIYTRSQCVNSVKLIRAMLRFSCRSPIIQVLDGYPWNHFLGQCLGPSLQTKAYTMRFAWKKGVFFRPIFSKNWGVFQTRVRAWYTIWSGWGLGVDGVSNVNLHTIVNISCFRGKACYKTNTWFMTYIHVYQDDKGLVA